MTEILNAKSLKSELKMFRVVRIGSSFEELFTNVIVSLDNALSMISFGHHLYLLLDPYYMKRSD